MADNFDSSSSDDDHFISLAYKFLLDDIDDDSDDVLHTRATAANRDRVAAHGRLYRDYFADDCVYDLPAFKRRFRLSRHLFVRIANTVENRYPYFQQKTDARDRIGLSGLQKCTAALRLMAYGNTADAVDEYLQMSERTSRECMYQFARAVVAEFSDIYLRRPNATDVQMLYEAHEQRHGFPGMLGSLDCTHWDWQICPTAWKRQYTWGHHGVPSLVLEAVASQDLWFWHAYFGVAGSNNDRNVLDQSPIFDDLLTGKTLDTHFSVNGNEYNFGYYLVDGIYPTYSTFVKAPRVVVGEIQEKFKQRQESARKNVERVFGVLKVRWHIVKNATRPYHLENLKSIMYACIIMHNMIIEEDGRAICPYSPTPPDTPFYEPGTVPYLNRVLDIQDTNKHNLLQNDLSTHIFYTQINAADDPGENVAGDDIPDEVFENEELPDSKFENDDNYDDVVDDDD